MTERYPTMVLDSEGPLDSLWIQLGLVIDMSNEITTTNKRDMLRCLADHLLHQGWKGPKSLKITSGQELLDALQDVGLLRSEHLEPLMRHLETRVRSAPDIGHQAAAGERLVAELARQRSLREKEAKSEDYVDKTSGPPRPKFGGDVGEERAFLGGRGG